MCAYLLLGEAKSKIDLGGEVLPGLHLKEIEYLITHEWVVTANDLLWRRTKLGLDYTAQQHEILENFFRSRYADSRSRD